MLVPWRRSLTGPPSTDYGCATAHAGSPQNWTPTTPNRRPPSRCRPGPASAPNSSCGTGAPAGSPGGRPRGPRCGRRRHRRRRRRRRKAGEVQAAAVAVAAELVAAVAANVQGGSLSCGRAAACVLRRRKPRHSVEGMNSWTGTGSAGWSSACSPVIARRRAEQSTRPKKHTQQLSRTVDAHPRQNAKPKPAPPQQATTTDACATSFRQSSSSPRSAKPQRAALREARPRHHCHHRSRQARCRTVGRCRHPGRHLAGAT